MRQLLLPAEGKVEPKLEERFRRLTLDYARLLDVYFLPGCGMRTLAHRFTGSFYRLAG
jgi:hypothetical protein